MFSECEDGYFGTNCDQLCGQCAIVKGKNQSSCDIKTGSCIDGCKLWWITDTCRTEIGKADNKIAIFAHSINRQKICVGNIRDRN